MRRGREVGTEFLSVFHDCVSLDWNVCTQCLCHALRGGEVDPNIIAPIVSVSYRMMPWLILVNGMVIQIINLTIHHSINHNILDDIVNMVNVDGMVNHIIKYTNNLASIIPSTIYVMT